MAHFANVIGNFTNVSFQFFFETATIEILYRKHMCKISQKWTMLDLLKSSKIDVSNWLCRRIDLTLICFESTYTKSTFSLYWNDLTSLWPFGRLYLSQSSSACGIIKRFVMRHRNERWDVSELFREIGETTQDDSELVVSERICRKSNQVLKKSVILSRS